MPRTNYLTASAPRKGNIIMMRIISGSARGTKLVTLEGENTRPTLERVKEALFSMIQFEIADADVLDLFAGSGQLALEALSRGAGRADAVDSSADANRVIRTNIEKTHMSDKCTLHRMPAEDYLERYKGKRSYSLVFLDPPYAKGLVPSVLKKLSEYRMLEKGAVVVCEVSASDGADSLVPQDLGYSVRRDAVYSRSRVIILDYNMKGKGGSEDEK